MIRITVPDYNDSFIRFVYNNQTKVLRFTYNPSKEFWTLGLYSKDNEPIVNSIKIVPNFPLNLMYRFYDFPSGTFVALTNPDKEKIYRDDFNSGSAKFYFIPDGEKIGSDEA